MNEIAATTTHALAHQIESQKDLIRETFFKDGTPAQFQLFVEVAKRVGLSPLTRQITPMIRRSKNRDTGAWETQMTILTNVDGFRVIAERSGKYAGQVGPFWCGKDGVWHEIWLQEGPPVAAKVGVLRSDFKEPLWAVARFESYAQTTSYNGQTKLNSIWGKMPDLMIAKVAECLALRKAFPNDLSGLYGQEEMDQAREPQVELPAAATGRTPPPRGLPEVPPIKTVIATQPSGDDYRITFGKFKDRIMSDVPMQELESYAQYLESGIKKDAAEGKRTGPAVMTFLAELEKLKVQRSMQGVLNGSNDNGREGAQRAETRAPSNGRDTHAAFGPGNFNQEPAAGDDALDNIPF